MNITRTNAGLLGVGTMQYNINIPGLTVAYKNVKAQNADQVNSTDIRIINNGEVIVRIPLSDITQINGVSFSGTAAQAVVAINGLVGQVAGGGGTAGVSQTYVDNAVQNLKTTVDAQGVTLKDVDTALDEQISTLAQHNTAINNNTTAIGQHATTLLQHTNSLAQHTTDIGKNTTDIGKNTTDIGNNASTIAQHETTLGQHATSIGANTASIGTNIQAISDNSAAILLKKPKSHFVELNAFVDFPSVAPGTLSAGVTISNGSTTGVTSNDVVTFSPQVMSSGLVVSAKPGTNLITFFAYNPTAAAIDPAGGTFKTVVTKPNATATL